MKTPLLGARKLTPAEVTQHIGVTEATLANWRSKRIGPLAVRIGRRVWYFTDDLEAYLQEERRKANALKTTGPVVALPHHPRRPRARRFDGVTGHRGGSKGRQTIREEPAPANPERPRD